jgi:HSP20 family protein
MALTWVKSTRPCWDYPALTIQQEDFVMAEAATKLNVKTEQRPAEPATAVQPWRPFETLRREVDRLFQDFEQSPWRNPFRGTAFDLEPLWRRDLTWAKAPAVDIVEKENGYEVTAELPGMDEKNIEVKVANGVLAIKGEKQEEKEEKKKDYYLQERHFGSFERRFQVPEGVDTSKIEASFTKGVLTVTLPKAAEAKKAEQKITVKAA